MSNDDLTTSLLDQIDWHWQHQARPRLDGLTDAEYLWEPAPGWSVRKRTSDDQPGTGDFTIDWSMPEPDPAPLTTIAWRIEHVVVGVLAMRNASHFGAPEASYLTWPYAGTADEALAQLDEQYAAWNTGVRGLDTAALAEPCGPAEGAYSELPLRDLVLHINRELIHHLAEVALLRDLYAHSRETVSR